ncbi:MAG: DUF917 family protein [Chloroflexi bacterium]|nr:DUF917 family protein [Chloroflexota bacterium]
MDEYRYWRPRPCVLAIRMAMSAIASLGIRRPQQAEDFARRLTIEMGGSAALVMPVMTGAELKATVIRDTVSLAKRIGEKVLDCRARSIEPAETVAALCNGRVLFSGKIIDVERRTVQGFARAQQLIMQRLDDFDKQLRIDCQKRELIAAGQMAGSLPPCPI